MDGRWQIGQMTAVEYGESSGRGAADAICRSVAIVDRLWIQWPGMATYLEWDAKVLEQCYDYVDGLSLHRYYENTATGNRKR
jgi:alpha-N-arabinofuranosidase